LTGAGANTSERALRIGSNWDQAIDANGTLISLAELQVLDAGIEAADLTTQGSSDDEYCLTYESGGGAQLEWQSCGGADPNGSYTWTADHTWNLANTENLDISHNLSSGSVNAVNIVATPSVTAGTANAVVIQQADGANSNGLDAGIVIDNADADLAIADGLLISSAAGGITDAIDVSDPEIVNAINIGSNLLVASGDQINDFTGNGLAVSGNSLTLALQSSKGLEADGNGLSLVDCSSGEILKYNGSNQWACSTDDTGAATIDLDNVYDNDSDKLLAVDSASGLTFNLTSTGGFVVQDNGDAVFQVLDNGNVVIGDGSAGNLLFSDGSGNYVTVTASGITSDYSLTLPAAGGGTNQCLKTDASVASQLVFGSCAGAGGGADTVGGIDSVSKSNNGAVIQSSTLYLQTADDTYPGLVSTGSQSMAGTKTFLDGITLGSSSNLLASNFGLEFSESDTNPSCSSGDYKVFADASESTLKKCLNGTVSDLDTTGSSVTLDGVYDADSDPELLIDNTNGLVLDMTTTGDFVIQDSNTAIATFDDSGGLTFAPNGTSDVTISLDDDSQLVLNGTVTNSGAMQDINLTFAADAAADTVSALNIDVTSANDTASDNVYAVNIGNLSGAGANTNETAIRIGSGWDQALDANGTLISLAELQILDANIDLTAEVTGNLPIGNGGTGANTAQGAINVLSGLTTNGDLLYNDGNNSTRLARGSNGQCLTSNATTIIWGSCGASGDNIQVNSSAAADLNFLDVAASSSVAGTAWTLTAASNPDDLTLSISNASGTVAGVVTAGTQTIGGAKTFSGGISAAGVTSTSGLTSSGTITLSGLDCTGNANGGKVTADASGVLSCADDAKGIDSPTIIRNTFSGSTGLTTSEQSIVSVTITPTSANHEIYVVGVLNTDSNTAQDRTVTQRLRTGSDCSGSQFGVDIQSFTTNTTEFGTATGVGVDSPATTSATTYHLCAVSSGTTINAIAASIVAMEVNLGADLAELYNTDDASVSVGDVVSIDPSLPAGIKKTTAAYDSRILGIVSTNPAILIGGGERAGKTSVPVALSGRVPVKVSAENGPISAGDMLTASSTPGLAMKATKAGPVLGIALDGFGGSGQGEVLAFVKPGYFNGANLDGLFADESGSPSSVSALAKLMNRPSDASLNLSDLSIDRVAAGLEIVTPKITVDTITLNTIEATDGSDINVRLSGLGRFVVKSPEGNELAVFHAGGTEFSGQITADKITANQIDGLQSLTVSGNAEFKGNALFRSLVTFVERTVFRNDVRFEGHIQTGGDKPEITPEESAGYQSKAALDGNDTSGTVTFTTGTDTKPGKQLSIKYKKPFQKPPRVLITPANDAASGADYYVESTPDGFSLVFTGTPLPSADFVYNYWTAE
jgi:hypothetical protein